MSSEGWSQEFSSNFNIFWQSFPFAFQIKLERIDSQWSGSLALGVMSSTLPLSVVPPTATEMKDGVWMMSGSRVRKDSVMVKENYGFSLDRIQVMTQPTYQLILWPTNYLVNWLTNWLSG